MTQPPLSFQQRADLDLLDSYDEELEMEQRAAGRHSIRWVYLPDIKGAVHSADTPY